MDRQTDTLAPHDVRISKDLSIRYYHRPGLRHRVVFLHPSAGYGRMWEATAALLGADYEIFALDQRGHGDSGRPDGEYSAEAYAQDLRTFFRKLAIDRAILAGQSLGGRVAQVFAGAYPEQSAALVLVGGPHLSNFYQTRAAVQNVYGSAARMLVSPQEFGSRDEARAWVKAYRPLDTDATVEHRVAHNMTEGPDGTLRVKYDPVRVAQGLTRQLDDLKKFARRVRCPVAIVRGTENSEMTETAAQDVATFWSRTTVDIYSTAGVSALQMESPDELAAAIREFVAHRLS